MPPDISNEMRNILRSGEIKSSKRSIVASVEEKARCEMTAYLKMITFRLNSTATLHQKITTREEQVQNLLHEMR